MTQPAALVVVDPLEAAAPASQALAVWRVELVDGQIILGDTAIHPLVARDLWLRLGALVGQAERDGEHARWEALNVELDRQFRRATPARAHTLGRPSVPVDGMLLVEREDLATLRVATFAIAPLRPTSRGWEGAVFELRPTNVGHDRHRTGVRIRLAADQVPKPRAALPGPAASPAKSRAEWIKRRLVEVVEAPLAPPVAPVLSDALRDKRARVAASLIEVLAVFGDVGDRHTLDELGAALRIPRAELRELLGILVERGELAESDSSWIRTVPPARGARRVKKGGTRFVDAPKARRAKVAPKPPVRTVKPPPPESRLLRCGPCNRSVQVPEGTAIPTDPRCSQCRGPLTRWTP